MITKEQLIEQMVGFINNEVSKEVDANKRLMFQFKELNTEQRIEWIKTFSPNDILELIALIREYFTYEFDKVIDDDIAERLKNNDDYIRIDDVKDYVDEYLGDIFVRKDNIDAYLVDALDLSNEVTDNYLYNLSSYGKIEKIKDMLDTLDTL